MRPGAELRRPAVAANVARNARAHVGRHARWAPARAALWGALDGLVDGASVVVAGAGNGDDLPLAELAAHAARVTLVDVDPVALAQARRTVPRPLRERVALVEHDVTLGMADAVCSRGPGPLEPPRVQPLPGAPFDLAVGDLLYSQLLYPGLVDAGVPERRIGALTRLHGPVLTRLVVERLHASAPRVLHVHDPLGWWRGHPQPVTLDQILAASDPLPLIARGLGPKASDPRAALGGRRILRTSVWRWPFADGVDYLACATLADSERGPAGTPGACAASPP